MNYGKLYERAISKYKSQSLEVGTYTEKHHIIPRHLGGDDSESNLVVVSYRQHILLHLLLWKRDKSKKDEMAYKLMRGQIDSIMCRRELCRYAKLGTKWSETRREVMLEARIEWQGTEEFLLHQQKAARKSAQIKADFAQKRSDDIIQNAERNEGWLHKASNRSKYKVISPEGLVFDSPIFAAKYYSSELSPTVVENWSKRKKYGWNTQPELAKK